MSKRRLLHPFVLAVLLLLFPSVPQASATNFDFYKADGGTHTFFYKNLESAQVTASNAGRNDIEVTNAGPTGRHSSEHSYTDVVTEDGNYGGWMAPYSGYEWCVTLLTSTTCGKARVLLNLAWLENYNGEAGTPYTATERARVTCHEFGHSLGLEHQGGLYSCMRDSRFNGNQYDFHDRGHLNGYYN